FTCTWPEARNTTSTTTSPSIFAWRASGLYSGRGFSRMFTGVEALSPETDFFLGASATGADASEKPACFTLPCLGAPPLADIAVPLPNPALATVPMIPWAPTVPLQSARQVDRARRDVRLRTSGV